MIITKKSVFSGITRSLDLPVTQKQLNRFATRIKTGEYVQDIFPDLSPDDREFILSGITPEEWDEVIEE